MISQYLYAYTKHVSYFRLLHTVLCFCIRCFLHCGDETNATNLCIKSFVFFYCSIQENKILKLRECILLSVYCLPPKPRLPLHRSLRSSCFSIGCAMPRATETRGQGGTMNPEPMDFRGPAHRLQEGRWLQRAQQRAHELERGPSKWPWEISMWGLKTFFFGDHQISTGNTVKISVKAFFFGDHIIIRTKLRHFLRLFWSSQNRKSVIFVLAPGPRLALGGPGCATTIKPAEYYEKCRMPSI